VGADIDGPSLHCFNIRAEGWVTMPRFCSGPDGLGTGQFSGYFLVSGLTSWPEPILFGVV
jgi:hypothetical protein